jgi:hypothetical protein
LRIITTIVIMYANIKLKAVKQPSTASFLGVKREGGGLGAHDLVRVHPY